MSVFKCPGAERIRASFPDEIPCPCGRAVEIWPDEAEARCPSCGGIVGRVMPPACVGWCASARVCVGEELYARYLRSRGKAGGKEAGP